MKPNFIQRWLIKRFIKRHKAYIENLIAHDNYIFVYLYSSRIRFSCSFEDVEWHMHHFIDECNYKYIVWNNIIFYY